MSTQVLRDAALILEGGTQGSVVEGHVLPGSPLTIDELLLLGGLLLVTLFIWVFIRGKEMNWVSYTFCPEIRRAHLSLS